MATDTTGWTKNPGGPGGQGILSWTGAGPAPMTDAGTQQALRNSLGFSTGAGTDSGTGGFDFASAFGGAQAGGEGPGLVPYEPGPITGIVNDLLTASIQGGGGGGPAGQTLFNLSSGAVPPALMAQYQQNQGLENASITESMGKVGNRFGTDLARTLADAAGRANVNLAGSAMDRALQAISQIIGLGGVQAGLEFQGNENALNRANQDFLATSSGDSFTSLLPLLIGLGQAH